MVVANVWDSLATEHSSVSSDWLLQQCDNRGRHSANQNLLPDMHLHVPVFKRSGRLLL